MIQRDLLFDEHENKPASCEVCGFETEKLMPCREGWLCYFCWAGMPNKRGMTNSVRDKHYEA